jgi:hypothetical protein
MAELMIVVGWFLIMVGMTLWCHRRILLDIAPIEAKAEKARVDGEDPDLVLRAAIDTYRTLPDQRPHRWCFPCWLRIRYLEMARREFAARSRSRAF